MSAKLPPVKFDATLEEIVEDHLKLFRQTAFFRRRRRQYQWGPMVGFPGGVAISARWNGISSYEEVVIISAVALIGGVVFGLLSRRYYDWCVRRNYRRLINEMYGSTEPINCEFEVHDDVLRCRSLHAETSLPWSRLTRVDELPGSIELWFNPGLAVIRDRAFRTPEERRAFISAVSGHVPGKEPL